jgi:hypothetical protein
MKNLVVGSYDDKVNAKAMPPSLKQYLDREIFEGKIPDSFDDCKLLRDAISQGGFGILLKTIR